MAQSFPFLPAASGRTPFRTDLDADAHENAVDLVRGVHDGANDPYHALSVLYQLLRAVPAYESVPAYGLVLLIEPVLAQLDQLRCDACTLNHFLVPGDVVDAPARAQGGA